MKQLFAVLVVMVLGVSAHAAGKVVAISGNQLPAGSIVIRAKLKVLDFILDETHAIRYPVAVPKSGAEWSGYAHVDGKHWMPSWSPPAVVRRDHPELPDVIPGGDPSNPMGTAALTLDRSEIAIHGSTKAMRNSIGTAASYGCVRMYNEDIADLYQRVSWGALVLMQ